MVLLTGGTGLVGAHLLIRLIENGDKVRATYRKKNTIHKTKALFAYYQKETLFDAIEWRQADVTNIPQLEEVFVGVDYVYHCAGLISFDPKDENRLRKVNIEGTANIVNFCLVHHVKKLCYISSVAALGDLAEHENIVTEETEWNPEKPHSDYAISKYGAEMEIWRGQQEGLQSIIINPGIILGPGFEDQGSGLLFQKVAQGMSFYTTGITAFIAVPDVVKIATELMNSTIINQRYALVAQNSSYKEVLNSMSDALGVKRPSIHAKGWLLEIAWRLDKVFSLVFRSKRKLTKYMARSSYNSREFSNKKIKADLKISFIDIHEYIKAIAKV